MWFRTRQQLENKAKHMKQYEVEIRAKYPACNERPSSIVVAAASKSEAIREARRHMSDMGHTPSDGPIIYKATEHQG